MDAGIGRNEERNPREKAGFLSIITLFYNYKILKKGRRKDLEENDIYKILPDFESEKLGDKLEAQWKIDRKSDVKLWVSIVKCFGVTYLIYTIIQLVFGTVMILYQPKVFSKFVAYFQPNQTAVSTSQAYAYSAAIGGLILLNSLWLHNMSLLVTEYSMKIRTAVCSLIFRKALRISPAAFSEITIGKTVTLITKDVFAIDAALTFIKDLVIAFLQLTVVTYLLYERVGSSAFPSIAVIVLIIPIQLICGKLTSNVRLRTAKRTDQRFRITQEVLGSIKVIKMYTWQKYFEDLIGKARLTETNQLNVVYYLKAFIGWLGAFAINISFYILLVSYTSRGYVLQAETVYFVQQCLSTLRTAIMVSIPMGICNTADLLAALKRIQSFLDAEETANYNLTKPGKSNAKVYLEKVRVHIRESVVLKSVSLAIDSGLLLVTGNLGSGKTVFLKTVLGEYPIESGYMNVNGAISYAPEDPWIFPSTVKQNILFGEPYNQQRYIEVLKVCALTHDIARLEKLDETIIGDNGINLSKGQQARISLARAVYRDADIYLLDNCLASLDNNISDHIFQNCIKTFLKDKICIFVTSKFHMTMQAGISNVLLLKNGNTLTLEQQNEGLDKRITYYIDEEVITQKIRESYAEEVDENDNSEETKQILLKNGIVGEELNKNIYQEEKKVGGVQWYNYLIYFKLMGGGFVFLYLIIAFAAAQAALSLSEKIISIWVNLEQNLATYTSETKISIEYEETLKKREYYLHLYTMLIVSSMVISIVRSYSTFYVCLNAARTLHNQLISALLRAYMKFFDKHYIGNIINRLSKDLYQIDEYMPFLIFDFLRLIFNFIGVMVVVATVNWLLFIPGVFLLIKLYFVQRLYLPTGRSLRRLEASSRSPVIGYLNSALEGVSVIRSSQKKNVVQMEFDRHQDLYTSAYYMNQTTTRFFTFILDLCGAFFVMAILFKLLFLMEGETAADVGLVVSQSMMLSGVLQYAIKQIAELESTMTSVERILEYTNTDAEKKSGKNISDWPSKGRISFENVSLTYDDKGVKVLNDISFEIGGRNKVGIVGRTGAGKTSVISVLFRLYEFDGKITIDNEDINFISLEFLRSHITLIPQNPTLFSGTLRTNLDPFNKFSDEEIWGALEKVHMKSSVSSLNQDSFKSSYSSGERQLLCLARALLQNNKIIVLDEATSNLDPETDLVLQKTLKDAFEHCTVIIIAHKFQCVIWCDKVLTLKDGSVVECDDPMVLLNNKNSILNRMIREENFETFVRLTQI